MLDIDKERDVRIKTILLFEYYKQLYGEDSGVYHYVLPELKDIDNQIIDANVIFLIDENYLRGTVEYTNAGAIPFITRINSKGMKLVESIVEKAETFEGLEKSQSKDFGSTKEKILFYIGSILKNPQLQVELFNSTKDFFT